MKKVDYEHFGRFLLPNTLDEKDGALYFCARQADFDENKYQSDLYRLRDGELSRLTASGDVLGYTLLDKGIVFPSLRNKKDRERLEKGLPLTVLQILPYDGGEAREFLRLERLAGDFHFLSPERFFFIERYSRAVTDALEAAGGDTEKVAAALKKDSDYSVFDELPFWFNGKGLTNKTRSRLCLYDHGRIEELSAPSANVDILALSPDGATLYYSVSDYTDVSPLYNSLFALDTSALTSTDISAGEKLSHESLIPLQNGGLALLAQSGEKYGVCENVSVFYLAPGESSFLLVYGDGDHCFGSSVGSDIQAGRSRAPSVMSEGAAFFFLDTLDDSSQILRFDCESGEFSSVTHERGCITDAIFFGSGFAAIALRGNGGCEIYDIGRDGSEKRLSSLNSELCSEYEYSAPQDISFINEKGDEIHGWVIPPVGLEAGKNYPAILDIHGGPRTVYGNCYFHEMQLWADMGYAVIFCNPTGSDGRGERFADLRGAYGSVDYNDIMAFLDNALEACPYIDQKRLGVTGGSYGGFMTNWIIGHTNRFSAAASQRSISNWISFTNSSDIGPDFGRDQVGADPWTDVEKVWAHSPLKYADKVTTPTLFIHSDEDYRCWMAEGIQMFTALRTHGVETRLCLFKGENHELSRSGKPLHRVRRLREISEWFDKYLKPAD